VVVIGSANSSNTRALEKLAHESGCARVYRINAAGELPDDLTGTVGVTAGASAPEELFAGPEDDAVFLYGLLSDVARVARPEAARSGVEIVLEPGRNLPRVTADSELIAQACANLLSNGIQAMPDGGTLTVSAIDAGDRQVTVTFADTGFGMSEDDIATNFQPFHGTFESGTGLGLAIVYRIIEEHGGTLRWESTPGSGTTFTATLPIKRTQDE